MAKSDKASKEGYVPVTGGNIWYQVVGKPKDKPAFFIMHGGPGVPHDSMKPALSVLSDERQIVFYDQLGCGKSDRPTDKRLWREDRFVEEFGLLRAALGIKKYHLLGHSWGSYLAAKSALEQPKGMQSLILSGPLLSVARWEDDANKLKRGLPKAVQEVIRINEAAGTTDSKEYKEATRAFYNKHYCRIVPYPEQLQATTRGKNMDIYLTMWGPSEFYCTGNLKGRDLTERIGALKIPVLLSAGRFDEVTPETIKYYQGLFRQAEVVTFDKSAHVPYVEEPRRYTRVMRDFISRHDPRTVS